MGEVLRAEEVAFFYPQHGRGLPGTSLSICSGEGALISGQSGCGKSTLARCLTGIIPHLYHGEMRGSVWLDGHRTDQTPLWKLAEKAGFCFQNPVTQMLAPTVEDELIFGLENLGLSRSDIRKQTEEALVQFGLGEYRYRAPQRLSGGEQQKLALATMIARQPAVLVLDEPLSMLDTRSALEFIALLDNLIYNGKTLVVFEHRLEYFKSIQSLHKITLPGKPVSVPASDGLEWPIKEQFDLRLEVSGLNVERGGKAILQDFHFNAEGGQVIALVGRNGVGKTTLLRALAGFQDHSGNISIWKDNRSTSSNLGMVFQNPDLQLFNATVRDEILYRVTHPDLGLYQWLVEALELGHYEQTPPLLLSEGEKRRVALATVLMHHPEHGILLDEPSLGQDSIHKEILLRMMHALAASGKLVIIASHDLELVSRADRLVLLGSNGIVADDHPDKVLLERGAWEQARLTLPDWIYQRC
jgi:energy-coupling factor transport system ATP-binding protein